MDKLKILVTGGAGFIGSHLCDALLENGNEVVNLDNFDSFYSRSIKERNVKSSLKNPSYNLEEGDIRDIAFLKEIFKKYQFDLVIHLAALAGVRPSIQNPILYEEVNVKGTMNIMEMCKEFKVSKLICASSSSVYGNNKVIPFSEEHKVDYSISPYAATKKSCEVMGHVYHSLYNIDMIMLRFFTVYGPRQRPDLAIHKFTNLISKGEEIPYFGDGSTQRDYTYIDDIIDGVLKSMYYVINNQEVYEILNLGESETISLKKMVETIENALNSKAIIKKLSPQPGDVEKTYADISKARNLIGYNPITPFKTGIENFVNWYKNEKNEIL
ncbi:GDP-mannose 4,6-dehydratase [Niallia alba]|uniref:GDP-mannose 4,6-dehydratase n=1 Tax=Niallia alba TaxID=2729105 RepID=UPI0039A01DED